jgi:energy-coupling factor transporter ATP-binding protein EcfA2
MSRIEMKNMYDHIPAKYKPKKLNYKNHKNMKIDLPMRGLVIGSSGSGKSSTLLQLLELFGCFTRVYLFALNLEEPLYEYLLDGYNKASEKLGVQLIFYSNKIDEIPSWENFDKNQNNLVIFDDLINEKNISRSNVGNLFTLGRKQNISCLFLSQSFFKVPMIVRQNSDYIFILRVNSQRDLARMLSEYQLGVNMIQLNEMYSIATKEKGNFLLLDVTSNSDEALRYRKNFEPFILTNDQDDEEQDEDDE